MSPLQVHVTTPHLLFLYMGSEDRSQITILTRQALYQPSSLPVLTHSLAFSRLLWDPASLSEGELSPLRQPETNPSQGFLSYGLDTSRFPPPTLLSAHDRRETEEDEAVWNPTVAQPSTEISVRHPAQAVTSTCPSDRVFPLLVLLSPTVARLSARSPWFQPPACIFPSHPFD